jgi:hypothetical protein
MNIKNRDISPTQNSSEMRCNTKDIIINFRVTAEEWECLLERAGERGKLSRYIRRKLGLKEE